MTRKSFLATIGVLPAAASVRPAANGGKATGIRFRLNVHPARGIETNLLHEESGLVLASGSYSYSFETPRFRQPVRGDEGGELIVEGETGSGIGVRQHYRMPQGNSWIEEQITIRNRTSHPLALPRGRAGFSLPLTIEGNSVTGPLRDFKFTAVPYRREPRGDRKQYADYTLAQVLTETRYSGLRPNVRGNPAGTRAGDCVTSRFHSTMMVSQEYPEYASEGWVLTDGRIGFLITKYSQKGMEWSLLDRVPLDGNHVGLRWGGFGIFEGDPEHGAWIAPGAEHSFGVTRVTAFNGGITEGFYTFRAEMESRGHACPKDFNPPVHWNELYDNKLWWNVSFAEQDKPEARKKYYTLASMKKEAGKARDIGCEALYLDPGWDTNFASKIWDEQRLGKIEDFAKMLRDEYGLSLSLHTPMSGWCNPSTYSRDIDRMNRDGTRAERWLCGASKSYCDETFRRLDALARGGARYFMFDGTIYSGECWDPNHGHPVPARLEEQVQSLNRLARMVHERYPHVLIEMHDQLVGGTYLRYVPTYYGQGASAPREGDPKAAGWDDVWAYELMWDPMKDLVSGNAIVLYYYNLAYSMPLYIHIDLRKDNINALMLWWNASTCRHLGMGGTHSDPAVRAAQKAAMRDYCRLKPFFTAGTFYGIDEMTHVHRHPAEPKLVINCFNLEKNSVTRTVEFDTARFGLRPGRFSEKITIPAYGHVLLETPKS